MLKNRKWHIGLFAVVWLGNIQATKAQPSSTDPSAAAAQAGGAEKEVSETATESTNDAMSADVPMTPSAGDATKSDSLSQDSAPANTAAQASPKARPEPTVEEKSEPSETSPVAGYDDGFFLQSPDEAFKLKIEGQIKARYTVQIADVGSDGDNLDKTNFAVPFARLSLTGHLFKKKLTFLLTPEFGGGELRLVYAWGDFALIKDKLHFTFGQMKRPFSRNYLVSSTKNSFIGGPIGEFGDGIDIGLQLSNNYLKAKGLEWAFGLFNNAGVNPQFSGTVVTDADGNLVIDEAEFSNGTDRFSPAITMRIGYNNGAKGYVPTDFEGGSPRFGIGASSHFDFNVDADDAGEWDVEGDFILKAYGFSMSGAVYVGWMDEGNIWNNPQYGGVGAHGQLQYFFKKHFEPVLRYSVLNPEGSDNVEQEATAGFTFYFYKQTFKLENNFSSFFVESAGDLTVDLKFVSQLQLIF